MNILYYKLKVAFPYCVANKEVFPLPVCRIAFVNKLYDKLRVASLTCYHKELLPLPICRMAFVNILYNK